MEEKGRILAIDPGTRRIGLALSDELQVLASPHSVLESKGTEVDLAAIAQLIQSEGVVEIVVGVPYRLDGSKSATTERALSFLEAIRAAFAQLVVTERDEGLTTWAAQAQLSQTKRGRKQTRVDAHAAAVLLQEVLDERQSR